ncbi:unnamed protein product [Darwinula stevensoni]|uniref:39S ribosomal protein L1, mitochondrial n=1 Tax=Darwinula stevensoni TaxID=69355 RepID=A0A7R8X033_9CRUS|nr:unnamed protein product [Darwinula stevensoni]CAG0878541.1 unnamed protein product [Darwinula stevensoni]
MRWMGRLLDTMSVHPNLGWRESVRHAARKGTREKRRRLHKKKEVVKRQWVPPSQLKAMKEAQAYRPSLRLKEAERWPPLDDVYMKSHHRLPTVSLEEALAAFQEIFHPTMFNEPNNYVHAFLELDLTLPKKSAGSMQRYLEGWSEIISFPNPFNLEHGRRVLAFSSSVEVQTEAMNAGAALAGGAALIKDVQTGLLSLQDFDYFVASPDIVTEIVSLRGLMKKRFPTLRNGSLSSNVPEAVKKFVHGVEYSVVPNAKEPDYAAVDIQIGMLSMAVEALEENLKVLALNVMEHKPPQMKVLFIQNILLKSPPCREFLKLDRELYTKEPLPVKDIETEPQAKVEERTESLPGSDDEDSKEKRSVEQ